MLNQPVIVERITEKDEEALRCLKNIEVQEFEDIKSGYRILFVRFQWSVGGFSVEFEEHSFPGI